MAYSKTEWVNNSTPISANNLNHIENGIYDNDRKITTLQTSVETINTQLHAAGSNSLGFVKPDNVTTRVSADGTITAVYGGGGGASVATQVSFNDGTAHLGTDNVQGAVDKITTKLSDYEDAGYLPKEGVTSKSNVQLTTELADLQNMMTQVYIGGNSSYTVDIPSGRMYIIIASTGAQTTAIAHLFTTSSDLSITNLHTNSTLTFSASGKTLTLTNTRSSGGRITLIKIF